MNVFSTQGRALPSKVRNQIIDKWLSNEDIANIAQQINLPYKTVSNIVDLWVDNGDIEPRKAYPFKTARTNDVITYVEYLKTNKLSIHGKEIQQELQRNYGCLPKFVAYICFLLWYFHSVLYSSTSQR